MEEPVCLIENNASGELRVNQEAVSMLSEISQPVVVVAIVGLYRTGKSYLMNKLARKQRGFSLGSTIQSHTKGIWMWCVPHPLNPDHCLVLLDTEGLGDVEKMLQEEAIQPLEPVTQEQEEAIQPLEPVTQEQEEAIQPLKPVTLEQEEAHSAPGACYTGTGGGHSAPRACYTGTGGGHSAPQTCCIGNKGDEKNDSWIFALAVLLSSMLVYNSMGTIDQYAMEKLHYITELTELIKVKSAGGDDESVEFARFFPAFVWSIRDFTLKLVHEGKRVTEDEYLDIALKLKPGISKKVQDHNLPRECIRNYFPTRKCFVFDRPADKEVMEDLDQIPDSGLHPDFVRQVQGFVKYVYHTAQIKRLKGGFTVSGKMLGTLALTYVDAIRSGTIPCLESTVHRLAQIENTAAVSEAVKAYEKMMEEQVRLPTETVKELSEIHNRCQSQALQLFMKRCFKDEGQKYQQEFMNAVAEIYCTMCKKNCQESEGKSTSIISELGAAMKDKIKRGSYTKPGGYAEYERDLEALVKQYRATPGKGIQAEQVLHSFRESQKQLSESLRQADVNMTAKEKKLAAAQERAELAEQERKREEEEKRAAQQLLEDQKRAMEESLAQLREKAKQDQLNLAQEHQKVLEQRLLEQQKLLQEGFQGRAGEMQQEIDSLKKQQKDMESPSIVDMVLDTAILAAPGYYKAIPIGAKVGKFLWNKYS